MTYTVEKSLKNFEFWGGAKTNREYFTEEDMDLIEDILESDCYTPTETEINDMMWFDVDTLAQWCGCEDFEEMMERRA